ncbi:sensor histidine kinase [Microbacter margulisiae]|uniref:histidine kinase n=1 Tax=Microbacter margulisiae TaxID=1350067 RepID=A0A7W5DS31_9PORP|nr:HAMP domain-containing sensor histidine kinase [Microbacter margulisiae]MBB3188036.1 two-component sensor histidine kinase [Microbacter margulisiae]
MSTKPFHLRLIFITIASIIALVSLFFTNRLINQLANEERQKIEIWAEATRLVAHSEGETDLTLIMHVLEGNTTIPVVMVDSHDNFITSRNIHEPKKHIQAFRKATIQRLKFKHPPIEIDIDPNTKQFIYYDDSLLIKELAYFPYIQLGVIALFILVSFWAFSGTKKAEQNQVWVGLSKETAHQLGTPISSLMAWIELLKAKYSEDALLPEMEKDIRRLKTIAERFSKIGSRPELIAVPIIDALGGAITYMRNRISNKVTIEIQQNIPETAEAFINIPLFEWVIENLCKNAIDAMDGSGKITITLNENNRHYLIDVQDTGKGMAKRLFKTIFTPGFTTKKRGWGLGLSLAKRIIEEYHNGKIYVKQSEINHGTVFRIALRKTN